MSSYFSFTSRVALEASPGNDVLMSTNGHPSFYCVAICLKHEKQFGDLIFSAH